MIVPYSSVLSSRIGRSIRITDLMVNGSLNQLLTGYGVSQYDHGDAALPEAVV